MLFKMWMKKLIKVVTIESILGYLTQKGFLCWKPISPEKSWSNDILSAVITCISVESILGYLIPKGFLDWSSEFYLEMSSTVK
jgi:hypothetical protein